MNVVFRVSLIPTISQVSDYYDGDDDKKAAVALQYLIKSHSCAKHKQA